MTALRWLVHAGLLASAGCGRGEPATVATPPTFDGIRAALTCTSEVTCPAPTSACWKATCKSGLCAFVPAADGKACDDGSVCTIGDSCKGGACVYATSTCECISDSECKKGKKDTPCFKNVCLAATGKCGQVSDVADCEDGNACTLESCDAAGQCARATQGDGTACGNHMACDAGICLPL